MKVKRILYLFLAISTIWACSTDPVKKPDRELLLSENKLVSVLTETYLAGGVLDVPAVRSTWGLRDSIQNYTDILESMGCTKEQLDATLYYYFASKPKKMARVYDKVIANLMSLEESVRQPVQTTQKPANDNLWTGKSSYLFPDDYAKDPIWFDIRIDSSGIYTLKADCVVYPDDKSLDPRVTVYFSTRDATGRETQDYWDEVKLEKNGKFQKIEMSKAITIYGETHIEGWLMNHTNQQGIWEKHARIRNISLTLKNENLKQE